MTTASTKQDTGKFRQNLKDQFFTSPAVAATCVTRILSVWPDSFGDCWIEPSAGGGVFVDAASAQGVSDILAMDISPTRSHIQTRDFLKWNPEAGGSQKLLLFGNPPFGRQGSLAKAFIAHGTSFAYRVALILPRSFQKASMSRAFPREFHCCGSEELPENAFLVNGCPYDVPCVFQLWEYRPGILRELEEAVTPDGFTFVKFTDDYDFVVRRVGVRAGAATAKSAELTPSPQSHYFLRLDDRDVSVGALVSQINCHTFPSNTTGPRSLTKSEVNVVINALLSAMVE